MIGLARALGWPRVELSRKVSRPDSHGNRPRDTIGPGVEPWFLFAEQFEDSEIADATRKLERGEIVATSKSAPPAPDDEVDATPEPESEVPAPVAEPWR